MKNPWMKKIKANRMSSLDIMIENQKIYNELVYNKLAKKLKDWDKISLEIVEKLSKSPAFELVSIQPMVSPNNTISYHDYDLSKYKEWVDNGSNGPSPLCLVSKTEPVISRTRAMKSIFSPDLAEDFVTEVFREIVTDLRNNAGTIATYKWGQKDTIKECTNDVFWNIHTVDNYIFRKTLISPKKKWVVMSPKMASIFDSTCVPANLNIADEHPHKAGILCGFCDVYVDPLFPESHILIGHVTEGPCYTYCPYVAVGCLEHSSGHTKIISRYAKKLPKKGAKSYGLVKVEDFQC